MVFLLLIPTLSVKFRQALNYHREGVLLVTFLEYFYHTNNRYGSAVTAGSDRTVWNPAYCKRIIRIPFFESNIKNTVCTFGSLL